MKSKHFLTVPENPYDELEVEHVGCYLRDEGTWGDDGHPVQVWDCGVEFEISNGGISTFFRHKYFEEEEKSGWYDPEFLAPGTYEIERWEEISRHWEYGDEINAGLSTVEKTT